MPNSGSAWRLLDNLTPRANAKRQIHELVGDAKSHAERLFKFPSIGRLDDADAREVLREPARQLDVRFGDEALAVGSEFSEGYPYFLQEFDEYLKRAIPHLAPPPIRRRSGRSDA